MGWPRIGIFNFLILFVLLALVVTACTPSEEDLLKGMLQNVDMVNGEVTITTQDGRTVTLKITTETEEVETNGTISPLETLEPGAPVEIKISKDRQTAQHIKAKQAEAEGIIIAIGVNEITIQTENGRRLTIRVTGQTRIELESSQPGTLDELSIGKKAEIKFNVENKVTLKIAKR